jgi:hypothetical protein
MTEEQKKSVEDLGQMLRYLGQHAGESVAWQREFDISSQIYTLLSSKNELSTADFGNIVDIFNKINDDIHFDGSGWHDFKIRLNYLFRIFGYDVTWDISHKRIEAFGKIASL